MKNIAIENLCGVWGRCKDCKQRAVESVAVGTRHMLYGWYCGCITMDFWCMSVCCSMLWDMFILCMNLTERLVIIAVKLLNKMLKSDTVLNCFVSLHMPICICMCVSSFMVWGKKLRGVE